MSEHSSSDRLDRIRERLQRFVAERDWQQFHDPKNLAMAIASEGGELLSELRWVANDEADTFVREANNRAHIEEEVGDIGIALLLFCARAGIDLFDAIERKTELNEANYPVRLSKGRSQRPRVPDPAPDPMERVVCEWEVVAVRPLPGFRLDVEFADGTRGRFDYFDLIHSDDAGVFVALRDVSVFNRVGIEHGAVTWPGELDVAPDAMYDRLKANPPNTIVKG